MKNLRGLKPLLSSIAAFRNAGCNINIRRTYSNNKGRNEDICFSYSIEQQRHIVGILEKCVQNNVTRPYLSEKRLQCLKPLFERNSNIQSLEQLLHVNGIGPKVLHRICDSILEYESPKEPGLSGDVEEPRSSEQIKLPHNLITPSRIEKSNVESVVSIHLGINAVSWTRLRTSGLSEDKVDSWDIMDLSDFKDKKYDVHSIWALVLQLRQMIPDGDVYLMEDSNWSNVANIKKPMKYHIQEAMITAAICSIFNQTDFQGEHRTESTNRLYFIRTFTPFRLFNKIVGCERVSAQDIVLNMMEGIHDPRHRPITFSDDVAEIYLGFNGPQRDDMCRALLLAISFAELILRCNPEAFSAIGKSTTKKKKPS